jgi:hypothetical protein
MEKTTSEWGKGINMSALRWEETEREKELKGE